MVNFTLDSNSARAERFKPGGKWYDTYALEIAEKCNHDPINCEGASGGSYFCWDMWGLYARAYEETRGKPLDDGWMLVILEPYNKNSHPIMVIGGRQGKS